MSDIKVGDKITIEGLNIDSKGGMHFNKPSKKRRRLPMEELVKVNYKGDLYTIGETTIELESLGPCADFPFNRVSNEGDV
jgi:hypothetical protein